MQFYLTSSKDVAKCEVSIYVLVGVSRSDSPSDSNSTYSVRSQNRCQPRRQRKKRSAQGSNFTGMRALRQALAAKRLASRRVG